MIEITLLDLSVPLLIIVSDTLLGSSKPPQPGYYLRISKGGHGSSVRGYQSLFVLLLKKDILIVCTAGESVWSCRARRPFP